MAKQQQNGCLGFLVLIGVVWALAKCGGSPDTKPSSLLDAPSTPSPSIETKYVTSPSLNCRAEGRSGAARVAKLSLGDRVEVSSSVSGWSQVEASGKSCWVASRFLSDSAPAPVVNEMPTRLFADESARLRKRGSGNGYSCGGKRVCGQMNSCAEAMHYLNECGLSRLDRDSDGIPCESIC